MKLLARLADSRTSVGLSVAALAVTVLTARPGGSASTSEGLDCATD